ncbi:hypothetical protein C0991_003906 [Blastosporella zonata]|nr:hypothetical protein C0991_003906 [Blastosporella zonata]
MAHSGGVNDRLHALRGEHFRRAQNVRRSLTHVSANIGRTVPTLPIDLTLPDYPSAKAPASAPGPQPPKSWTLTKSSESPHWRQRALSLLLPPVPTRVPTLAGLCLRSLAALPAQEFAVDIVPWLAPHLRRDLVRHAAVYAPLGGAKLWPLYEPDGHADTEMIVVGPYAGLRDDYFIRESTNKAGEDWDADVDQGAEPLSTLVLMCTRLATSTLLSLPPTITRLALLNLTTPIPLHRLPSTCPLLVVLDLSYNVWLCTVDESDRALDRVEWSRWSCLGVLGLRECAVSSMMLGRVNRGRWDDVEVVLQ